MRTASTGPYLSAGDRAGERASSNSGGRSPVADGPVYFVADAHLGAESEEAERTKSADLIAFLAHLRGRASHLYLAGDLFDFWFEYPTVTPHEYFGVLKAISELSSSGTSVAFIGGNHDYWAGEKLESMTGASVHRRPVSADHFGKRIFVAHGDGLPQGDIGYRMLKAVIRSRPAIAAFRMLHPTVGAALARWASGLSEITDERIRRATPPMREFLESKLDEGFDVALVGHIHEQMVWEHESGTAVVIGDWMEHRSVVELSSEGVRPLTWAGGRLAPAT